MLANIVLLSLSHSNHHKSKYLQEEGTDKSYTEVFYKKGSSVKVYFLSIRETNTFSIEKMEKQNWFSGHSSPLLTRQVEILQEENETQVWMLER